MFQCIVLSEMETACQYKVLSKHKFEASLHQLLLHTGSLEIEDTYVDTPTLINKLSKLT